MDYYLFQLSHIEKLISNIYDCIELYPNNKNIIYYMESILLTGKTLSIIRTLGVDGIIATLHKTTSIIGSSITYISSIECSSIDSIKSRLLNLDIEKTINIIHHFITELESNKNIKESTKLSLYQLMKYYKTSNELEDLKKILNIICLNIFIHGGVLIVIIN